MRNGAANSGLKGFAPRNTMRSSASNSPKSASTACRQSDRKCAVSVGANGVHAIGSPNGRQRFAVQDHGGRAGNRHHSHVVAVCGAEEIRR